MNENFKICDIVHTNTQ